jgi:SAM-dependent methyltransferase
MVARIVQVLGLTRQSRVLSVGCGIADTEILLAPRVGEVVGIDLSPSAIEQARADARLAGVANFQAICGTLEESAAAQLGQFDAVIAIFFLHHLPDAALEAFPALVASLLKSPGAFYALDPSRYRLSGFIGERLFPKLMERFQSPGERQLSPQATAALFERHGFDSRFDYYDFVSTPLAGLLPGWRKTYRAARVLDELLIRFPLLRLVSSNFEIIALK